VATVTFRTTAGRGVLAAAVLGSGVAFLDATVVNVALPAIGEDLDAGLSALQWVLDGYLLTLGALLLLGGSLGDLFGRRLMFLAGLAAFSVASALCGLAPSAGYLVAARVLQGAGGALLVPGSLAILSASFRAEDRSEAVGAWSGLAGVTTALGPFAGGWLVDAVSWRLVFLVNLPLAALAAVIALRYVPESRDPAGGGRPDWAGAVLATVGLGGVVFALIERSGAAVAPAAVGGVAALAAFPLVERRRARPLVPPSLFRSRQFLGTNLTTLAVYAALGGALFLVALDLQTVLGYSALEAGAAMLPITLILLALSARAGRLARRTGPRPPLTVGPVVAGAGLLLLSGLDPGDRYLTAILPGVAVLGLGMAATVAPLTSAVLAAVDEQHVGAASGFNNAVARVGGLLAVAVLPVLAGVETGPGFHDGVVTALRITAGLAAAGGLSSLLLVGRAAVPLRSVPLPDVSHACHDPCLRERSPSPAG